MPSYEIQQVATPVWSFLVSPSVTNPGVVLFVNTDENDTITIGTTASVAPEDTQSTAILTPQGSVSLPADQNYFAVTDAADVPLLMVVPGGGTWAPTQVAIDTATIAAMALEIAEQLAASGVSFLANPVRLYGGTAPEVGSGLVGVTLINLNGSKIGCDTPTSGCPSVSNIHAIQAQWDTLMGTPGMGVNVSKRYCGPADANNPLGEMPSAGHDTQNMANVAASGSKLLVSYRPVVDPTAQYTGAIYQQAFTALVASAAYVKSVASNGVVFTLDQECNLNMQQKYGGNSSAQAGANLAAYYNFYGPAFKTPNQPSRLDLYVDYFTGTNNISDAYNGGSYLGQLTGIVCDSYCLDYTKEHGSVEGTYAQILSSIEALADAAGLPFGFWEWGVTDGQATVPILPGDVPAGEPVHNYFQYWNETFIIGTMQARLKAGKPNADVAWYISGVGGNNPQQGPYTDNQTAAIVKEIQNTFNTLSSTPVAGFSIPATTAVVVPPLAPSPGGGYAIANGLSYDITINLTTSGGSTKPFVIAEMAWFNDDIPNAQPVSIQHWALACGKSGSVGTYTLGKGPQRGQFLQITLTNEDTVSVGAVVQCNSTSRTVNKDDWLWDVSSSAGVPQPASVTGVSSFALAGGGTYANSLGSVNSASIPASGAKAFMFGLFTGEAFVRISGESNSFLSYMFNPFPQDFFGSAAMINESPATEFGEMIICPRGPLICIISNSDVAAHNANIEITTND